MRFGIAGGAGCVDWQQMCCEDETAELLRRGGHKLTPQRLAVVGALRHDGGHVSATQLAALVHSAYPSVDVSTVYRTMDVLKRMRLATSTDLGSGDAVFEWAPEQPHHHLVCSGCGKLAELGHEVLADLEERIVREFKFAPDMDHFAIFGSCWECQQAERDDDDPA